MQEERRNGIYSLVRTAVKRANEDLLRSLLFDSGLIIDVNDRSRRGTTLLMDACTTSHIGTTKLLLSVGADVRSVNRDGATALILASKTNNLGVIKLLGGSNVNHRDSNGNTALFYAAANGNIAIIEYLLALGANLAIRNNVGDNALMISARNGMISAANFIMNCMANRGLNLNNADVNGQTFLMIIVEKDYYSLVQALFLVYIKNRGMVDLSQRDENGNTAYYIAKWKRHHLIAELFERYAR